MVDYITPLEAYLIASIMFILLVMVEYVFVLKEVCFDLHSCRKSYNTERMEMQAARKDELASLEHGQIEQPLMQVRVSEGQKRQTSANAIDRCSRIILPPSYMLFIMIYFTYYSKYS